MVMCFPVESAMQTDRQMDRQTDRQTGRQTKIQTDRQTDRKTDRQTKNPDVPSRFLDELQKFSQLLLVDRPSLVLVGLFEQIDKPDMVHGHEAVELQDESHRPRHIKQ